MNPLNLFKFLEKEKGKPMPLKIKLIHGLPLTPEDIDVKGYLDLSGKKITSLPQDLKVGGSLNLEGTKITSLPPDLQVGGSIILAKSKIISLPSGLQVGNFLNLENTSISSLPPDLKVGGNFYIGNTPLAKKSDEQIRAMLTTGYIKGNIYTF